MQANKAKKVNVQNKEPSSKTEGYEMGSWNQENLKKMAQWEEQVLWT